MATSGAKLSCQLAQKGATTIPANTQQTAAVPNELREYDVTITETLQQTVQVSASSKDDAELAVSAKWRASEYVLGADDYTGVEFMATPAQEAERHGKQQSQGADVCNNSTTEEKSGAGNTATPAPLSENTYVKALFGLLKDNGKDASGLTALISCVEEMESIVKSSASQITEMKAQLESNTQYRNRQFKELLGSMAKMLENKAKEIKGQVSSLKSGIVSGCKRAVAAFKSKGISALDNIASFFKIQDGLTSLKHTAEDSIKMDNNAIANIEAFASEYHSAGRAIKNLFRLAAGKQPIDAKKEAGKLAKTVAAPYKAHRAMLAGLNKAITKAAAGLETLENNEAAKKAERQADKKPSILNQLRENQAIAEQLSHGQREDNRAVSNSAEL